MKAAIYVRVSTDQQAEKGYSIHTQLEACRQYALELGAIKAEEFIDDGYSGEFIDRPALSRMREKLLHCEFDVVIAYAPDRLARKTIHLLIISEEIAKAGALRKFASVNFESTAEGELMYKFQGIVAEYEKEKIRERTMRGKRGKASKGLVISDADPLGFNYDATKSTYLINHNEAELVKMIFDFVVNEQMGTVRICKELNARGIPSPRAKKAWSPSSVHRILTNTIYKGILYSMKYRYEKIGLNKKIRTMRPQSEWIPVKVPAIVGEATWQKAQEQLKRNKDCAKRNLKRDYLLNGLVYCAQCGRKMAVSHSGFQGNISYYACKSASPVRNLCPARQIPAKILDEYVFNYVMDLFYISDPGKLAAYLSPRGENNEKDKTALAAINKTQKELLTQKDTLLRWFQSNILTEEETENKLKEIRNKLTDLLKIKESYENKLSLPSFPEIADNSELIRADFTVAAKRAALRAILEKVVAARTDNTRGRGSRPELDVQLQLK